MHCKSLRLIRISDNTIDFRYYEHQGTVIFIGIIRKFVLTGVTCMHLYRLGEFNFVLLNQYFGLINRILIRESLLAIGHK